MDHVLEVPNMQEKIWNDIKEILLINHAITYEEVWELTKILLLEYWILDNFFGAILLIIKRLNL